MEKILTQSLYEFDMAQGKKIVGVDEAGRGPLAGAVVAAASLLKKYDDSLEGIQDSKKLTEKKRELLFSVIPKYFYVGIGRASVEEIEKYNILNATFLARSEEHTSELQSRQYLVCRLLLEKKK